MMEGTQRRLAAIVSADVVGYSRLMGRDEAGTLRRLNAHRSEHIDPLIAKHGGRIVKTTGDGLLLEFPSVVAAVECCLAVQMGMAERNAAAGDDAIRFRIGVHLGDVIVEGDDIFGDGVNIAARLQEISEADGLVISSNAHDSVEGRIEAGFVGGGEQELKNIARPVRVWRWSMDGGPATMAGDAEAPPLPDKPSIAVLPFNNMSGDPEQEYFADGISEDIIMELSRFREFLVIARNSSFVFKGKSIDIKTIAHELGVRYLVQGSVRKAENRIRVNAQLIDGTNGDHLWGERFDRDLADIFAVQDEITVAIIAAIAPRSIEAELRRTNALTEAELGSWDLLLRARPMVGLHDKENNEQAQNFLTQAIELDPGNAQALAWLCWARGIGSIYGWGGDIKVERKAAKSFALRAVALDPDDAVARLALGIYYAYHDNEIEQGSAEVETALRLNPNLAWGHGAALNIMILKGDMEAARTHMETASQLSPRDPMWTSWLLTYNIGVYVAGHYEEVVERADEVFRISPDNPAVFRQRAAALAMLGRSEEARQDIDRLLELIPGNTISQVREQLSFFPDLERFLEGLRKAGLPE